MCHKKLMFSRAVNLHLLLLVLFDAVGSVVSKFSGFNATSLPESKPITWRPLSDRPPLTTPRCPFKSSRFNPVSHTIVPALAGVEDVGVTLETLCSRVDAAAAALLFGLELGLGTDVVNPSLGRCSGSHGGESIAMDTCGGSDVVEATVGSGT